MCLSACGNDDGGDTGELRQANTTVQPMAGSQTGTGGSPSAMQGMAGSGGMQASDDPPVDEQMEGPDATMLAAVCPPGMSCAENTFVMGFMPGFAFCGADAEFGHTPPECGAGDDCSAYPGSSCQDLMVIRGCLKTCTP